ncbi:MAG: DUF2000 domain-containing protein [Methylococcales bacterium]
MYADNHKKFVAVLNRKHPASILMNALGHMTAGLIACSTDPAKEYNFLDYNNADAGLQAKISHYPYIVLTANNSNQIRTTLAKAAELGLQHNAFVTAMLGQSAQQQIKQTRDAKPDELDYVALVLFGDADRIDALTRRFSLYKNNGS